jgi:hypothetical protein
MAADALFPGIPEAVTKRNAQLWGFGTLGARGARQVYSPGDSCHVAGLATCCILQQFAATEIRVDQSGVWQRRMRPSAGSEQIMGRSDDSENRGQQKGDS